MNIENRVWPTDEPQEIGHGFDGEVFYSPRSGCRYRISRTAQTVLEKWEMPQRMLLSEYIRRASGGEDVLIDSSVLTEAETLPPPTVSERFKRGLDFLISNCPEIGKRHYLGGKKDHSSTLLEGFKGAIYANDDQATAKYIREYESRGYLETFQTQDEVARFVLGFQAYIEREKEEPSRHVAFVAMWFDEEMTAPWTRGIDPAIRESGYLPLRIDQKEHNNKIDDEIISEIRRCRFLVADFTSAPKQPRGGVYFEAGFAMGLDIPVIWMCRSDLIKQVHFDTRQFNHIVWDDPDDLCERLRNRILATIGEGPLVVRPN